jgi:hypothetical protein
MPNRLFSGLIIFICFAANYVAACPYRTHIPTPSEPGRYRQIFWAHVKTVELIPSIFTNSDLTAKYKLTLTDPVTLLGPKFIEETVNVGPGCGWPEPKAGVKAIFFVEKDSWVLVPAYESNENKIDWIIDEVERKQTEAR